MANKKRRRRMSLLTKAINVGILLLAFSRPLELLAGRHFQAIGEEAIGKSGALGRPGDIPILTRFYGPMVAAIVLKKAISMVRRTARV